MEATMWGLGWLVGKEAQVGKQLEMKWKLGF